MFICERLKHRYQSDQAKNERNRPQIFVQLAIIANGRRATRAPQLQAGTLLLYEFKGKKSIDTALLQGSCLDTDRESG